MNIELTGKKMLVTYVFNEHIYYLKWNINHLNSYSMSAFIPKIHNDLNMENFVKVSLRVVH